MPLRMMPNDLFVMISLVNAVSEYVLIFNHAFQRHPCESSYGGSLP